MDMGHAMEFDIKHCILDGVGNVDKRRWLKTVTNRFKELMRKRVVWQLLLDCIRRFDGEVVLLGDINEVHDCSEQFNSSSNHSNVAVFNQFVVNLELVDVNMGGLKFT
ncbi:hypothetical protein L2E82_14496 [Cichorium intybus]|uniref:Uncharacterized protein n=1 Tax=Cichorium intybus TaxID=13427 RepID=A0ACB9F1G3_CICIN|nr:hypothetical protein L2E82_14496 [Cichorium intybus]